jgi:thioredoxin-related protein
MTKIYFKNIITATFFLFLSVDLMAQSASLSEMYDWKPLQEAIELASENDKKVLVYGNAAWCTYCKKMEKEVFTTDSVQQLTNEHFYSVWMDIESEDSLTFRGQEMTQMQFSRAMRITGTPTFIFIDSEGEIIAGQPGYIPEEMYLQILEYVGSDAYLEQNFGEFSGIEPEN